MKRVSELSEKISRKDAKSQRLNIPICRFIMFALMLIVIGEGCKPRTRQSETEKAIPHAVNLMMMEKSQREFYLSQISGEQEEHIRSAISVIEQSTDEIEFTDFLLGKEISVTLRMEQDRIGELSGVYSNGVNAMEFRSFRNGALLDSMVRFYPVGMLYSRRINAVDSTKSLYEEFHQNGIIRSRNRNGVLYTWFESGVLSGMYSFEGRLVGERRLWHKNGKLREISSWVDDTMNGPYYEWDSTGHLIRDMVFVKGKGAPRK